MDSWFKIAQEDVGSPNVKDTLDKLKSTGDIPPELNGQSVEQLFEQTVSLIERKVQIQEQIDAEIKNLGSEDTLKQRMGEGDFTQEQTLRQVWLKVLANSKIKDQAVMGAIRGNKQRVLAIFSYPPRSTNSWKTGFQAVQDWFKNNAIMSKAISLLEKAVSLVDPEESRLELESIQPAKDETSSEDMQSTFEKEKGKETKRKSKLTEQIAEYIKNEAEFDRVKDQLPSEVVEHIMRMRQQKQDRIKEKKEGKETQASREYFSFSYMLKMAQAMGNADKVLDLILQFNRLDSYLDSILESIQAIGGTE